MKRNRNSFFSNYNAQTQAYIPNGIPPENTFFHNQNYYSNENITNSNDIDNRLSKIERQINRLDNRLTKLENTSNQEPIESNYTNMYML